MSMIIFIRRQTKKKVNANEMCVSLFSLAKAGCGSGDGMGAFSFFLSHTQSEGERTWEVKVKKVFRFVLFFFFFFLLCARGRESVCENGSNFLKASGHVTSGGMHVPTATCTKCDVHTKNVMLFVFFSFRWMPLFFFSFFSFLEICNILTTLS